MTQLALVRISKLKKINKDTHMLFFPNNISSAITLWVITRLLSLGITDIHFGKCDSRRRFFNLGYLLN